MPHTPGLTDGEIEVRVLMRESPPSDTTRAEFEATGRYSLQRAGATGQFEYAYKPGVGEYEGFYIATATGRRPGEPCYFPDLTGEDCRDHAQALAIVESGEFVERYEPVPGGTTLDDRL